MATTASNGVPEDTTGGGVDPLYIGLGAGLGGALVVVIVVVVVLTVRKIKRKRAFEGKYSPTGNEEKGGVGMNDIINVIQVPTPERLI